MCRHRRRMTDMAMNRVRARAEGTDKCSSTTRQLLSLAMPVLAKGALVHAMPAVAISATPMSVAAMPVGVATPAIEVTRQLVAVVHLAIRHPARLDRIRVPERRTDISVGTTTTMTVPTSTMPVTTGPTHWLGLVLSEQGWVRASLRPTMLATTLTESMRRKSSTNRVHLVRHVLDRGS